jgi:hypothetical protein
MRASTSWRKRHPISEREVVERGPYPRSTRLRYCVGRKTDYEARGRSVSILWIVLIVVLVLALLGFFGRRSFF